MCPGQMTTLDMGKGSRTLISASGGLPIPRDILTWGRPQRTQDQKKDQRGARPDSQPVQNAAGFAIEALNAVLSAPKCTLREGG